MKQLEDRVLDKELLCGDLVTAAKAMQGVFKQHLQMGSERDLLAVIGRDLEMMTCAFMAR